MHRPAERAGPPTLQALRLRARVRAALRAAAERSDAPLVRAAFFAAAERSAALRRRAADRACFASAGFDAAARPSRFTAPVTARDRLRDTLWSPRCPAATARSALRRVRSLASPFLGGASFTPARRALDNPIAIACLVERAPCLPSRM